MICTTQYWSSDKVVDGPVMQQGLMDKPEDLVVDVAAETTANQTTRFSTVLEVMAAAGLEVQEAVK